MSDGAKKFCHRCGGNGLPQYGHKAGGMCFSCGAHPKGDGPETIRATATPARSVREQSIHALYTVVLRAEEEAARGTVGAWWTSAKEHALGALRDAPADVAARAAAALAKHGVAL